MVKREKWEKREIETLPAKRRGRRRRREPFPLYGVANRLSNGKAARPPLDDGKKSSTMSFGRTYFADIDDFPPSDERAAVQLAFDFNDERPSGFWRFFPFYL